MLKILNTMYGLKKINAIQTTDTSYLVKKAGYDTNLVKLKRTLLIMIIVISTLLLKNFVG